MLLLYIIIYNTYIIMLCYLFQALLLRYIIYKIDFNIHYNLI